VFVTLTQYIYKKQLILIAKLSHPKEDVLKLLPLIIAKALLIAFESKIKEKLTDLVICNDATSSKLVLQMKKWQQSLGLN